MKVTLVNSENLPVPPVLGGAIEQTLYETALAIRDPELTVVSPWTHKLDSFEVPTDIFYHVKVGAQQEKAERLLGDQVKMALLNERAMRRFYYLNGVTDVLTELDPDVIQVHNRQALVPFLQEKFPDKPFVLYMHNEPEVGYRRFGKAMEKVAQVVFVSHYLEQQFVKRFPKQQGKTNVIYNSVDVGKWLPDLGQAPETDQIRRDYDLEPGKTLLFVGRTVERKGIMSLVQAMSLVVEQIPGVKLLVVGSPLFGAVAESQFLSSLKAQAAELGDAVIFTGFVPREKTPYYYAAADVALVPSLWPEPFGKVVIEAMATGLPVIGSRRGAIPEIIDDGVTGVLVDLPKDPQILSQHIVRLLNEEKLREDLGMAARTKVERDFTTDIRLNATRQFYKRLQKQVG